VKAHGRFIAIEGIDGVGKSTVARLVAADLERHGLDVLLTREPGGSQAAEDLRRLLVEGEPGRWSPMAELLLHTAARVEHLRATILPALAVGRWVLCDRYVASSIAYQGHAMMVGYGAVIQLHDLAAGGIMPDLTVILDAPPEIVAARAGGRITAEDRHDRMGAGFTDQVRAGYRACLDDGRHNACMVDASGTPASTAAAIVELIDQRLGLLPAAP